jgi:hypothetical protein
MRTRKWTSLAAILVGLGACAAQAQGTAYKCVSRGHVTYSQVPCPGGTQVGPRVATKTDKSRPVPQDRAKIARRAVLSPEDRQECKVLDARLLEQQAALKAIGSSVTLQDEMPMVHTQKRLRELRC